MDTGVYRLVGSLQNYAWGGHEFIPELLGLQPEPGTPYAEYWLGAHEKAPSQIILDDNKAVDLDKVVAEHPREVLGSHVALKYGRLPYLLKVLDVERPLSIQVHPTKSEAEAGFERESRIGIPLNSPARNYKDRNHKPELMVALTDFWLLHGFLPQTQLLDVLRHVPEFHGLLAVFEREGLAGLYRHVMNMPPREVHDTLAPLATRIGLMGGPEALDRSSPEYWFATASAIRRGNPFDRGMFSIYLFNLVHLSAGQAIFQDAGIPHAYLHGQNIEVMANSDNVLRGGLTEKHVDVPELLRTVRFEGVSPRVIEGTPSDSELEITYKCPAQDFRLSRLQLGKTVSCVNSTQSTEIVLVMDGGAAIDDGRGELSLRRGESAVALSGSTYRIEALSEKAVLFRVSVP